MIGAVLNGATSFLGQFMQNQQNQNLAQQQQNWSENMMNQQNAYNQFLWNQQNKYNEGRYAQEQSDALNFWHQQNAYNSPQAQMARFKEAGLNPNLIYGQGSSGTASPIQNAGSQRAETARSADVKPYNRAQVESLTRGMDVFGQQMQFKMLQAQTDNLKAATNVAQQDALLKAQQTAATALGVDRGNFDYGIAKELRETSIDAARVSLEQQKQQLQLGAQSLTIGGQTIDRNKVNILRDKLELKIRQDLANPIVRQAYADLQQTLTRTAGDKIANEIEKIRLNLKRMGINDTDGVIWRSVIQNWDTIKQGASDAYNGVQRFGADQIIKGLGSMPNWLKGMLF